MLSLVNFSRKGETLEEIGGQGKAYKYNHREYEIFLGGVHTMLLQILKSISASFPPMFNVASVLLERLNPSLRLSIGIVLS